MQCVGLRDAKDLWRCTHHNCSTCSKNRASAGGLLYPCQCCHRSFCEDCLPETGVTLLEKVDRFEKLGFDSTKNVVYIICSPICQRYAEKEPQYFGHVPVQKGKGKCPQPMDLSNIFVTSFDLDAAQNAVKEEKVREFAVAGVRTRTGKSTQQDSKPKALSGLGGRKVEKLCVITLKVLGQYDSMSKAAKSVGTYCTKLSHHMNSSPEQPFRGFYWRFLEGSSQNPSILPQMVRSPREIAANASSRPLSSVAATATVSPSEVSSLPSSDMDVSLPTEYLGENSRRVSIERTDCHVQDGSSNNSSSADMPIIYHC